MIMLSFFIAYQLLQLCALPFFIAYIVIRKIKKREAFGFFKERMGFVPPLSSQQKNRKVIWLHAVSVGEVLSLEKIIDAIKEEHPTALCYLTVGTSTGKKVAQERLNADIVSFLPYDFLLCMLSAYHRIQPSSLLIVEAEIWPNLLILAHFKKIPITLLNARISARSKNRYTTFKRVLLPLFSLFKKIYTQSRQDMQAFKEWGIKQDKLTPMGNIKAYNVLKKKQGYQSKSNQTNTILLVGSLHSGELALYLQLYATLKKETPSLKLILAPRHFHWKKELVAEVALTGYSYQQWKGKLDLSADILLVCTLGELFSLYQHATLYFLGGTFVPIGGHNLLEPAAWSTPTIVGPHYENCRVIAKELLARNALFMVRDEKELIEQTRLLLNNPELCRRTGELANAWLKKEAAQIEQPLKTLISQLFSS